MTRDEPPKRQTPPSARAQNLLRRFPVIDLAKAVSLPATRRQAFLRKFVESSTSRSYAPTRGASPMIYAAQGLLIESAPETWEAIEKHLRYSARPDILDDNIAASKILFDFVRAQNYRATQCESQNLKVRLKQQVSIDLTFYVTDGERLIFQFPQLRREFLTDAAIRVLGSIIHHAYAHGDFAAAEIEVADIGCLPGTDERFPRIRAIPASEVHDRNALSEQIDEVYAILGEIVKNPPAPPGTSNPMGI